MTNKEIKWPWNRPWPRITFIVATGLVSAPILLFRIRGCGRYVSGNDTETACTMQPLLGYELTWVVAIITLGLLIRFAIGLARAVAYTRQSR